MWVLMRSLETENTCLVTGKAELFGRYRSLASPSARPYNTVYAVWFAHPNFAFGNFFYPPAVIQNSTWVVMESLVVIGRKPLMTTFEVGVGAKAWEGFRG
jgi:hypothetical protein